MPRTTTGPTGPTPATADPTITAAHALASLPWEELVTSALLGTDRRPPTAPGGAVPADGPAALLGAAALHTVRR
ncbi:hypothetical protein GTW60_16000, partial [Streptomyces sp. SID4937]|uniref:DUF5691 domain-containing protein n=1 Tax=Streptomyces sp. SID4937 TaxID=2690280 RepID=UPI00137F7AD5|nr:hypothetical protein [Streptomyces sp. SID4937]